MRHPENTMGAALSRIITDTWEYAHAYKEQYNEPIGEDGVLGDELRSILRGVNGLLNGPLGREDGGALSKRLYALAGQAGLLDENGEF
jgi:hypothetical protein